MLGVELPLANSLTEPALPPPLRTTDGALPPPALIRSTLPAAIPPVGAVYSRKPSVRRKKLDATPPFPVIPPSVT